MSYYYAIYYDDYLGIGKVHKATTMKNALAGLRKLLSSNNQDAGLIATSELPMGKVLASNRGIKGYVGSMNAHVGKRYHNYNHNGRSIKIPGTDYLWLGKGKRKVQLVMSDGSLREW